MKKLIKRLFPLACIALLAGCNPYNSDNLHTLPSGTEEGTESVVPPTENSTNTETTTDNPTLPSESVDSSETTTEEPTEEPGLVVGYFYKEGTMGTVSAEMAENVKVSFEEYLTKNSLSIDNVVYRQYEGAVADFTAQMIQDGDVDLIIGVGKNQEDFGSYIEEDIIYTISNTERHIWSLTGLGTNVENKNIFLDYLQTEEAKKVFNPGSEGERTDTLRIAFFTKYIDIAISDNLELGFEAYLKTENINIPNLTYVTLDATSVADAVDSVINDGNIDVLLGGGGNITTTEGTTTGQTLKGNKKDVTIAGSKRNVLLLEDSKNSVNAATFSQYLDTDEAKAILNPTAEATL